MSIRPVASTTLVNNLNQLSFEGKKKKNQNSNLNITKPVSYKLAVPLAAALTMAPLNVIDARASQYDNSNDNIKPIENVYLVNSVDNINAQKGVVIESKNFVSPKYGNYKINLISTDGNNRTFEKVTMEQYNDIAGKNISNDVKNLAVYNFQVVSDDGKKGSNFTLKDVIVDSGMDAVPHMYNQDNIVNYIEDLIDDPRNNNAIEKVNYKRNIRPDRYGYYQNVSNGDIMKNAVSYKPNGKLIDSCDVNVGGKITGKMRFYSIDNDDSNVEMITYQKNGYPELRIFSVYFNTHIFEPYSENPKSMQSGILDLLDANNKHYYVEDSPFVLGLADLQKNNKDLLEYAFMGISDNRNYLVTPKGAIMPVENE